MMSYQSVFTFEYSLVIFRLLYRPEIGCFFETIYLLSTSSYCLLPYVRITEIGCYFETIYLLSTRTYCWLPYVRIEPLPMHKERCGNLGIAFTRVTYKMIAKT